MKIKSSIWLLCLFLGSSALFSQHEQADSVDTTSTGYKIGYEIGSWLPFLIIITLALMVMYRARKYSKD